MARIVFLLFFMLAAGFGGSAQKTYFVYLQTEKQEPFYVQFNNKNISSSSEGYLILPKLTDGTYQLRIGFPRTPEVQDYDLVVKGDDAGYIVKKIGDNWGIANLQSGAVQLSGVELGKREASLAAIQLEREKRIADSISMIQAAQLEQKRRADSLLAVEFQKREDSVKAATAGLEMPKDTSSVPAVATTNVEKPVVKTQEPPIEKPVAAGEIAAETSTVSIDIPAINVDAAANTGFKSEDREQEVKVADKPVISPEEQKRITDSIQLVLAKHRADSIREEQANREAQQKIEEAREIMRKTLGQPASTGTATANASQAPGPVVKTNIEPLANEGQTEKKTATETVEKSAGEPAERTVKNDAAPPAEMKSGGKSTQPVVNKPASNNDPKFLDMDMGAEVSQPASKPNAAKPLEPSEKAERSNNRKPGMTSNNPNTRIVDGGATASRTEPKKAEEQKPPTPGNANCKDEASEKDFFTLRKKMAADDDPDEMLSTARKAFKDKCFSTYQVRNLCVLFLSDANKYRFLDMAYTRCSDPGNYRSLVDLLSDDYYIGRFNAMIRD